MRDTSRQSAILHPVARLQRLFAKADRLIGEMLPSQLQAYFVAAASVLDGIILEPALQKRLQGITVATSRARQYGTNFRNFMLYGPPGTGKTMFAKKLAAQVRLKKNSFAILIQLTASQSGLDYAILAGGDVGPLGRDAVAEIHRVFDWAKTSRRG